jgi:ketosteroid isomerase-like protein
MNASPGEMLGSYVSAFESLDVAAVVPFYQLPCTFIRPDGVWVVSDDATLVTLAAHLIDHARSQGYRRTKTLDLVVRRLAAGLATMTGVFIRYNATDEEIGRFGFTYVVRREGGKWKIIVAVAHDAAPPDESGHDTPQERGIRA